MCRCSLVLAVVLALGVAARGEVVFSNLGAGDPFHPINTNWVAGPATTVGTPPMVVGNIDVAAPFLVEGPQDFVFETAELALSRSAGTNSLVVRLLGDDAGLPGGELASATIGGIPDIGSPALVSADFRSAAIVLEAGARYWLVADSETDASMLWHQNTIGDEDFAHRTTSDWVLYAGPNFVTPAFRISGTIVPEPASAAIATVVAVVVWLGRRRRV